MAKLDQINRRLKCSEEDREMIKKELRYNKHEYLDNYFKSGEGDGGEASANVRQGGGH